MTEPHATCHPALDELIGEIAEEFTQRLVQGEQPQVEDYAQKYPAQAAMIRQLLLALESLRPGAKLGLSTELADPPHLPNSVLGDFHILREIGRGGMGIVYEAEQLSLRRRVALKVLPFAAVLDDRHLQRFKNEALAAAQLDHPNIVDVLAVGCDRGVHYYAMRYVEGQTLAQVIKALINFRVAAALAPFPSESGSRQARNERFLESTLVAGFSTQDPAQTTDRFRQVAEIGRQVAEGLDHAHQNGIIHRDVKPSNLIIDAKGRPWICDFGLAHVEHDAAALTRTGDIVGTLRYLSPEQVTAKRVVMDHRVDTYALGASLYELLTLRPAFEGKTRGDLMRQILSEEPCRPTKINPLIPAELEIILLKAMAKDPDDRYATTLELADDLQRFLEDRPIQAKRPSFRQRLSRWSRQHRTLVRSTAAVVLMGISALAFAVVFIEQARREAVAARKQTELEVVRTETERKEADRLRILEEQNFQQALRAVDQMLTRVAQNDLAHVPGMLPIRQKLLEDALALYRQFLDQRRQDSAVRLETVKVYGRVGEIQMLLGQQEASQNTYHEVIALLHDVLAQDETSAEFRIQLAVSYHNLGILLFAKGESVEAEAAYRQSLKINEALAGEYPERLQVISTLAGTHNNLGNVLNQRGERLQALAHYRQAVDSYENLASAHPKGSDYRSQLAICHSSLARFFHDSGDVKQAEHHDRRALELWSELAADHPGAASYRRELARAHACLGSTLRLTGEYEESKSHFVKALELQTSLTAELLVIPDFRRELARTHSNFSLLLKETRDDADAIRHAEKSLDLRARLAQEFPNIPASQMEWARSRRHLAGLLVRTGRSAEAVEQWNGAIPTFQNLASEFPDVPEYRSELAASHSKLAETLEQRGETAGVQDHFVQAVELYEQLVRESPEVSNYRSSLAYTWWRRGHFSFTQEQPEAAAADYGRAIALQRQLVLEHPESGKPREDLALCLYHLGLAQARLQWLDQSGTTLRESLLHYAEIMRRESNVTRYRSRFVTIASLLGELLPFRKLSCDDSADSLILAIRAWKIGDRQKAQAWFDLAMKMQPPDSAARSVYDRLLIEAELLTGFQRDQEQPTIERPSAEPPPAIAPHPAIAE